MGLLDEIGEEQERTQPNRCPVATVLPEMDKDDRADLEAAMANPALRHSEGSAIGTNTRPINRIGVTVTPPSKLLGRPASAKASA